MRMAPVDQALRTAPAAFPASERWAGGLFVVAALVPAVALLGWIADIPVLRGLGNARYAGAPLTLACFQMIAVAALLAWSGRQRLAKIVMAVPATLLVLVAARYLVGLDIGIERLLFAEQVRELGVGNGGLPGAGATTIMLLDCVAVCLMCMAGPATRTWAVLVASATFALSILAMSVTLIDDPRTISPAFIGTSTMSAVPALALATAIVFHVWADQKRLGGLTSRLFRQLAPAIIILPVFPSLVALIGVRSGGLGLNAAQFLVVAGNVLILALVLLYGLREARRRNHALWLSETQLRAILAGAPDAVIVTDAAGRIIDFSVAAERLWGYSAGDVVGRNIALLTPEKQHAHFVDALLGHPAAALEAPAVEITTGVGCRHDGSQFPLELRASVFEGLDGRCFAFFARDLSHQLADQDNIAELSFELAHLSRLSAMGELAADLAHELNQPLAAAANYLSAITMLQTASPPADPAKAREMLQSARAQILRAGDIIRRLREFLQRNEVEKRVEHLAAMIEDAARLVLVGSGRFDVRLEYDLEPSDLRVFVDRVQVQQVVVNLLRNAIEAIRGAAREEARISICARPLDREMVGIEIRDNGPGLPEEMLRGAFERFATTKRGGGMGVGLSISKRIVEAHGGSLSASNRPEGGASFRFTLPLATPGAHRSASVASAD
jgi:PAS domain S-box-containing protein